MSTYTPDGEFARSLRQSTRHVESPVTLPPACYTSPEFFGHEIETVFRRGWFAVTHVGRIPDPGDYVQVDVGSDPLLVVRAQDGAIRAMSAVCLHRGAVIAAGEGNCGGQFLCPYHFWAYRADDGSLSGAPYMTRTVGFDRERYSLRQFAVRVWNGFVFVSYDKDAGQFYPDAPELEQFVANYDMGHLQPTRPQKQAIAWNWKIMLENAVECYHCTALHGPLHETAPTRNSVPSPLRCDGAFASRVRNTHRDSDFTASGQAFFPILPKLSDVERTHSTWLLIAPNLFLSLQHDNVHYFLVLPTQVDASTLEIGYLYPEATLAQPDFQDLFEENMTGWLPIIDQDTAINESVQRGLSSSFAVRGPYSWLEDALVGFNTWLVDRYTN